MQKDYEIDLKTFYENNGFSAKYFVQHMQYFVTNHKKLFISFTLYRNKIVLFDASGSKLTLRPHYNGKSNRYASIIRNRTEIATLHYKISPEVFMQVVQSAFKC